MAEVPGATQPQTPAQGALQPLQVSANPNAFGGPVAAGLTSLAAGVEKASDTAFDAAKMMTALKNKADADNATLTAANNAMSIADEFKKTQRGGNAINNVQDYTLKIEQARADAGASLSNPIARQIFEADSRRAILGQVSEVHRFADAEQEKYIRNSAMSVMSNAMAEAAADPGNPLLAGNAERVIQEQSHFLAAYDGLDPASADKMVRERTGAMYAEGASILAGGGHIQEAVDHLDAHRASMDPLVYAQTMMKLKPSILANDSARLALQAIDAATGPGDNDSQNFRYLKSKGLSDDDAAALAGQFHAESSGNPQTGAGDGGLALGLGQWHPDRQAAFQQMFGHSVDKGTREEQNDFALHELTAGSFKAVGAKFFAAKTLAEKARILTQEYEIPADRGGTEVANRLKASQAIQSTASQTGGPKTSMEWRATEEAALQAADRLAEQQIPNNAAFRQQVENNTRAEINRKIQAAENREISATSSILEQVEKGVATDEHSLLSVPGMLDQWNTLPPKYHQVILQDMKRVGNEITPEGQQELYRLSGLRANATNNPEDFLNEDIMGNAMLPPKTRMALVKQQQEIKSKNYSALNNDAIANKYFNSPMMTEQLGLAKIPNNNKENAAMRGALSQATADWMANPANKDRLPNQRDMSGIAQEAIQSYQASKKFGGDEKASASLVAPKAPAGYTDQGIRSALLARGITNPTPADIAEAHRILGGK
jgi:hypothetical protein